MIYLLKYLKEKKSKIDKDSLFIFLDFDGTLAPIVSHPQLAKLSLPIKNLLKQLSKKYSGKVSIISGRRLKDLRLRVRIKNLIYAGNHGFEITGLPKGKIPGLNKQYLSDIKLIVKLMQKELSSVSGVYIEDKGVTVSVHYRNVDSKKIQHFKKVINAILKDFIKTESISVKLGKKVIEIRPHIKWNKGTAAKLILEHQRTKLKKTSQWVPIYIGDDVTDEDAFKQLGPKAITTRVGIKKQSAARFYLRSQNEVVLVLKELLTW